MRQSKSRLQKIESKAREVQQANRSTSEKKETLKVTAYKEYVLLVQKLEGKVKEVIQKVLSIVEVTPLLLGQIAEIEKYLKHAEHQISLIERRVFNGEEIPNSDKIHSIFEPHTRWISKGKAGVLVEFGLPVTIAKDQHGYILGYKIMETESDVDVAVQIIAELVKNYDTIKSASFDKGYWSKDNRVEIGKLVQKVIMPKKGRLNKEEEKEQSEKEFKVLRNKHSAVESSINGLNHTGMEKCYDHGIHGFRRTVALSVLARNIHTLGVHIMEKEAKQRKRKPHKKAA